MLILGLLLVAAAVVAALSAVFLIDGGQNLQIADIGISPLTLYLLGVLSLLALVLGLVLMRLGARRSIQSRRERKELKRTQERLRAVEAERAGAADTAGAAGAAGAGAAPTAEQPPADTQPELRSDLPPGTAATAANAPSTRPATMAPNTQPGITPPPPAGSDAPTTDGDNGTHRA